MLLSNKAFFIPSGDRALCCVLNSPIAWWISWRHFLHMKDEALSNDEYWIKTLPIPGSLVTYRIELHDIAEHLINFTRIVSDASSKIIDWLHHEFGLDKPGEVLSQPHELDANGFVAAVRKALPKSRKLAAVEIGQLKLEHTVTVEPARRAAAEATARERRLSDLVNHAYGLTPEDVALMWATAPPRMPFSPAT